VDISSKYRIIKELGNQSHRKFGQVFLVESRDDHELCVLKALKFNPENAHLIERLVHEANFTFHEECLPKVLEIVKSDSEVMIILKYKEGQTLDEFWKTVPKNKRIVTLKIILEELLPLFERLKEESLVHADIKPSNLIVDSRNEKLKLHLIDFGLALKSHQNVSDRKFLFPLGYASPELVLNRLHLIDHTSDLYSLGILIWKLFTGKLPLVHPNPGIFTNLQITHPLPEHDMIPKELHKILLKICHKHTFVTAPNRMEISEVDNALFQAKKERYQSLQEVISDLDSLNDRRSWISRVLS
jgi:serine/threonine protein kinase